MEYDLTFTTLDDWLLWLREHPDVSDQGRILSLVEGVRARGFSCRFCSMDVPCNEVRIVGDNYRETLVCPCGLNARMRLVLDELSRFVADRDIASLRVFAPEAVTPFARKLREHFPGFVGSEFTRDPEVERQLAHIRIEDLSNLSFPDASFDVAIINDVFEHLADLPRAIAELGRVLAPSGMLLATFPLAYLQKTSIVKARLVNGAVEHVLAPEYHYDPVNLEGALVFQVPGWDILDLTRNSGFCEAAIRVAASSKLAFCGSEITTLFLLKAIR